MIRCDVCWERFDPVAAPGALLFSPPDGGAYLCMKKHICQECYKSVLTLIGCTQGVAARCCAADASRKNDEVTT